MRASVLLLFSLAISFFAFAQKDPVERIWMSAEKTSKIEIYKAVDGNFYGKVIWLKEPNDKKGKPKLDEQNKDEKQRNQPIMGLLIIKKFKKSATANEYDEGTVYDPNNGKTYCAKLTLKGKELKLNGFVCGFTWLGRSTTWSLVE
jgi:uncharacterized protein (DUF2147 family)